MEELPRSHRPVGVSEVGLSGLLAGTGGPPHLGHGIPRQVVLAFVIKLTKHKPLSQPEREQASSSIPLWFLLHVPA